MGFTTGFTGGVTLTLSLAYLSIITHQRTRELQGQALRSQALVLTNLVDPLPPPPAPRRSEVAAAQQSSAVEIAKDRWNHEVENAVRWMQHTDWEAARASLEASAARLWANAFGESVHGAEKAKAKLEPYVRQGGASLEAKGSEVAAAAKGAFDRAKAEGTRVEAAAESAAKNQASRLETLTKEKAAEAKGVIASAIEKGRDQAKGLVDRVKTSVGVAEGKLEVKADGEVLPLSDPVQRALHQRYERPEAKVNRTVAQVLNERYTPVDERDNTQLRGL